jgi:hypothetical protein
MLRFHSWRGKTFLENPLPVLHTLLEVHKIAFNFKYPIIFRACASVRQLQVTNLLINSFYFHFIQMSKNLHRFTSFFVEYLDESMHLQMFLVLPRHQLNFASPITKSLPKLTFSMNLVGFGLKKLFNLEVCFNPLQFFHSSRHLKRH